MRMMMAVSAAILVTALAVPAAVRAAETRPQLEPLREPLACDGELVEVTQQNTLRQRYHSYDFAKDMAFYLERAGKNSAGRKPGKMRIMQVLIREIELTDSQGVVVAVCTIPEKFVTEAKEYEKAFSDVVYASSDGAMVVEWLPVQVVETIKYNVGNLGSQWWFHPKEAEGEMAFLKDFKEGDADFLFFFLHVAKRADNKQDVWPEYGGMAYGRQEIKGARVCTLNDHEIARGIHEWQHHIFDTTIQETENMTVTRSHGLTDAGYTGSSLTWSGTYGTLNIGPCLAYYRDCNRYYQPRDMWERWRLRPAHNVAHEPFSGKAYAWADVRHDYWFKLPQLGPPELQALTGLKTVQAISAEASLVFDVGDGADLASPRLTGDIRNDAALNNAVNFFHESGAFLATPTGKWLFVKPQMADLYVDVLSLQGKPARSLDVYGYVLEGYKALVAIRLPDDLPAPTDELSMFRPIPIAVQAEGLIAPEDHRFREKLVLTLKPELKGAKVHYTLDGTEPTEQSPLCEGPVELTDTATVKARLFGTDAGSAASTWARTFVCAPFSVTSQGIARNYTRSFDDSVTVTLKPEVRGGTIRYTLEPAPAGSGAECTGIPAGNSPAYEKPIVIEKTTTLRARHFDAGGKPRGDIWSARYEKKNLTTGKPVTTSGKRNENEKPEYAVDGMADTGKYWGTIPAPQWLQVDLEKEVTLDRVHIWPYWDGQRHYGYSIELSTDAKSWKQVVDASANSQVETDRGREHTFVPAKARYVRVNMLSNSANPAVHLVELQVFEAGK